MNDKLTLGVESLNRVKYIMEYDSNKTSVENLISEQTAYTNYLERVYADPKKAEELHRQNAAMMDGLYNWFSSFDTHDWLTLIEVSTGVLGLIPTPLSPLFLGISTIAGVADAGVYLYEGDKYMASMMFFLSIIPGGELAKAMKGSRVYFKRGVKGTQELIKKYKSGAKLTKQQKEDLIRLGKEFAENSPAIQKSLTKELTEKLIQGLSKKTPKYLINLLLILKKLGVIKLSEITLKIAGVSYTVDKLYLYVFRDSIFANKKDLDNRTRNELRALVNDLLRYDKEVNEFLLIKAVDGLEKALKSGVDPVKINPTESSVEEYVDEQIKQLKINSPQKRKAPSFENVINGNDVIKFDDEGESVNKIQKMLHTLGYDHLLTKFGDFKKWDDGEYGRFTKTAVEFFQTDNNITPVDGIVGKNTLDKLIKKTKEK